MFPQPIYFVLLSFCLIYALLKGGAAERIGTAIMIFGSALTPVVSSKLALRFDSVEIGILVVDAVTLIAFMFLAARVDRFWPIWVSALLGLGVLGHLARWYAGSHISWWTYAVSLTIWSYPILALLAIGTRNHHRRARLIAPRETG